MSNFFSKIPLLILCLIFAFVALPNYAAGDNKTGLGLLIALFICLSFAQLTIQALFEVFVSNKRVGSLKYRVLNFVNSFKPTLLDYSILFLFLSSFVASLASPFLRASFAGLAKYLLYFLFYFALRLTLNNKKLCLLALASSLIGLCWANSEGLQQTILGAEALATWEDPNIPLSETFNRVYSNFLNPNLYGAYLLSLWPINLLFVILTIQSIDSTNGQSSRLRKLFLYLLGIILSFSSILSLYLILQTGSRGAWLALVVQLGFLAFCVIRHTRSKVLTTALATGAGFGVAFLMSKPSFINRILSIFSSYDHSSNSFRLNVWKACLQMIAENPIFGIGPGSKSFYLAYGIYMDAKYSALGAYSLILELAVELGLLGILAFIFMLFCVGKSGLSVLSSGTKTNNLYSSLALSNEVLVVLALFASLIGLLFNGLFDIVILRPQIQVVLWLLLACLSSFSSLALNPGHKLIQE